MPADNIPKYFSQIRAPTDFFSVVFSICTFSLIRYPPHQIHADQQKREKHEKMQADADLQAVLQNQQAVNHATIMDMTSCDKSYTSEYKRFSDWVKTQPALATAVAPFLTRRNVDHYFTRVISCRNGCPNSMGRIVNALDWYAKHREHVGANPAFKCRSPLVDSALVTQKAFNRTTGGTANPGSDPHKGLKDILPVPSRILMMRHIYLERQDWGPASVNFTWGNNGAIRGASNRKMGLCDLNLSHGFGPELTGTNSRALLLILRRGMVHKDRHETDKQVCTWRHDNWLLCSVFATALYTIFQLTQNPAISFLHVNKNVRAAWWDIPLIDWDNYNGEFDRIGSCDYYYYCTCLT